MGATLSGVLIDNDDNQREITTKWTLTDWGLLANKEITYAPETP